MRSPWTRTEEPSFTFFVRSLPTPSTRVTPARSRMSGPSVGYRPVIDGLALTTARTPRATSPSAATRSRSSWSITAISPGRSRPRRRLVRGSTRARAISRADLARRVVSLSATSDLDVDVGERSPNVPIDLRFEGKRAGPSDHGRRCLHPVAALQRHPPQMDHHDPTSGIRVWSNGHPDVGISSVQTIPPHVPDRTVDRGKHRHPGAKDDIHGRCRGRSAPPAVHDHVPDIRLTG